MNNNQQKQQKKKILDIKIISYGINQRLQYMIYLKKNKIKLLGIKIDNQKFKNTIIRCNSTLKTAEEKIKELKDK